MSRPARLLVVGCGGIGGVLAGHLAREGHDLTVLTPNASIASALEARGVRLVGAVQASGHVGGPLGRHAPVGESANRGGASLEPPHGTHGQRVRVARSVDQLEGRYAAALLATQPPQVEEAALSVLPWLEPDAPLVCFQNGLCEERLSTRLDPSRVYGAVVAWGASMLSPGVYEKTSRGGFVLGRLDGQVDGRLEQLASWLRSVGPTHLTTNLRGARWSKLAFNCAVSSLGTLGGQRLGPLLRQRFVRRVALELMSEVVTLAQAAGVRLEKLSGTLDLSQLALTPAEREGSAPLRLALKHALLLAVGARYRRLRSSMLAALERGRPLPIAFLNGEVVTRARALGVSVPCNEAVCEALAALETGALEPGWEALAWARDRAR